MNPQWSCRTCGRVVVIQVPPARSPDAAKRKLVKLCREDGHVADPVYRAGIAW